MSRDLTKLATPDLTSLAAALRSGRVSTPYSALAVQRFVAVNHVPAVVTDLRLLEASGFAPEQIAVMLDMMSQDRQTRPPIDESIDLVTTGPEVQGVTNRDTAVVVRELFSRAERSVLVAGYAIYQGQRVFESLAERMQSCPSLQVRMFLEVQRGPGETSVASEILRRFAERFRTHHWPQARPIPEVWYDPRSLDTTSEKKSCLHAKCVVIDRRQVFVSSANFTEAAQERNIEVGLLVRSQSLAEQIHRFFETMIAEQAMQPVF